VGLLLAARLRVGLAAVPAAGRCAEPVGLRRVAPEAAAQPAVSPFAAVRVRILARVPAARRPAAETAVRVAWPNAEQPVEAARPDAEAAAEVARPDVAAVEAAAQPGAVAEEAGAELAAAAVQEVPGEPAEELPSGAPAWAFRQDPLPPFVAQPRLALSARAMGSSSVAWPTGQSWQAEQFSSLSCALGPGENSEVVSWRKTQVKLSNASDELTSVRPECGGFQTGTRIYFRGCAVSTRGRSRRIQSAGSDRSRRRRRGRSRTGRTGQRQFIRRVAWQFIRPLWLPRLAHGRRNLGIGISRRIFRRWLARPSWLDRRIFWWIGRHRIATLQYALKN
jgi:hypothetical protein